MVTRVFSVVSDWDSASVAALPGARQDGSSESRRPRGMPRDKGVPTTPDHARVIWGPAAELPHEAAAAISGRASGTTRNHVRALAKSLAGATCARSRARLRRQALPDSAPQRISAIAAERASPSAGLSPANIRGGMPAPRHGRAQAMNTGRGHGAPLPRGANQQPRHAEILQALPEGERTPWARYLSAL